jgi:hypothetical protein
MKTWLEGGLIGLLVGIIISILLSLITCNAVYDCAEGASCGNPLFCIEQMLIAIPIGIVIGLIIGAFSGNKK